PQGKVLKDALAKKGLSEVALTSKKKELMKERAEIRKAELDYEMPGENGPQVFQRLRKIPNAATTPIVFLTGVSDRKKIQEVMSLKPQGYVLKPINMEKLFSSIYSLIR
ncbi:MAG: response regulator, partial [Oscillospiraceae bacterium]|nr:response regulator [Oscillospiraceae bacterium]